MTHPLTDDNGEKSPLPPVPALHRLLDKGSAPPSAGSVGGELAPGWEAGPASRQVLLRVSRAGSWQGCFPLEEGIREADMIQLLMIELYLKQSL